MKKFIYLFLACIPLLILWFLMSSSGFKNKDAANIKSKVIITDNKKVAVLELFTSQGCSSCPAADRLLGTYTSKENVIVLSYHVDYWDRMGWKDPFSSKEYTQRQYEYASALHADVYTPQLVVNGKTEMIGSDAGKINTAIDKIFAEQPDANLSIKSLKVNNGKATINFDVSGNISNNILNIALVQKKVTTDIKAGENDGVRLTNYDVVKNLKKINKVENGSNISSIDISPNDDLKNMFVVLFLQGKKNNKISAADQSGF